MPKLTLLHFLSSTCLFFSQSSLAAPPHHGGPYHPPSMSCAKWILPVPVTADNLIFDVPRVDSNIDAVDYSWYEDTWSTPNITERTRSVLHVDETFGINVQLCVPAAGTGEKGEILQIATHGLGFDQRYWDVEIESDSYSYVRAAVKAGYSILTYDRLGTGQSDKPDAYDIVQAPVQLDILRKITIMARNGELAKAAKPHFAHRAAAPTFTKFVHIGHSLGSAFTNALQSKYPELSDGSIQTGWLISEHVGKYSQASFGQQYAPENDPKKFGDRGSGYIVTETKSSFQRLFVAKAQLDPKMLDYGNSIKQPSTVGEGAPTQLISGLVATRFSGPQLIFMGESDYPICEGDCKEIYDVDQLKKDQFPKASALGVHIQPGTGHGLTLHKNATAGYQVMFDFLSEHGL